MQNLWPHQKLAIQQTLAAFESGQRRVCLACPTGGGKTRISLEIAKHFLENEKRVAFYTSRKTLIEQSSRYFTKYGIDHGIRASGYTDERWKAFQVSSVATETTRLKKPEENRGWELHDADLVIVDESHLNSGESMRHIIDQHIQKGAVLVGPTATPIDLAHVYDHLIVAGTTSDLRQCGALVPAWHYGCDEPDLKKFKMQAGKDLSENQAKKAMMNSTIYGRVLEWYHKLNPEQKPTLLFAPGVNESFWFAEQFWKNGISAAHIDGDNIWCNGEWKPSSRYERDRLFGSDDEPGMIRTGEVKVLTNRFVAREGLDLPEIEHIIFATIMGSTQTYLQAGGRGLRACPRVGKKKVVIQDHGGHFWRPGLGSLNSDREWDLKYTDAMIASLQEDRLRGKKEASPKRCPQCSLVLNQRVCIGCGLEVSNIPFARMVVQLDGSLKEMAGDIFKPRRVDTRADAKENWKKMFFRARNGNMTFRQAEGCYCTENNWAWPDRSWPYMPIHPHDFFRLVKDVPMENLRGMSSGKREADLDTRCGWDS